MPGHSRELISKINIDNPDAIPSKEYKGCKTLWEGFQLTVRTLPDENFLGTRGSDLNDKSYKWKSY